MKIGIVTVYEPITNLGSYLQAYALKKFLEKNGHEVSLIKNIPSIKTALKFICKINPKREFILRIIKSKKFMSDVKKLNLEKKSRMNNFDLLIYGSDEIWNLENPYFRNNLFWGNTKEAKDVSKIAYAVSMGELSNETLENYKIYTNSLNDFDQIFVRDKKTFDIIKTLIGKQCKFVCDPTLLISIKDLTQKIKIPSNKYLLVYTYGLDRHIEEIVVAYAKKYNLKIVSPCFWHIWADKVIECSALQFSSLINGAECVFTSTFHGTIFTLLNHKRCCILPVREKVEDVVSRLGEKQRLIDFDCSFEEFEEKMSISFDSDKFEKNLSCIRSESEKLLLEALSCSEK